ncbi:hypothetical protein AB0M97_19120 [Streptomyces sp. NPDC051207]|uniref:hypothetical protein n=1 Tax=Streptomyces sp. NPDC051207 TaxID=3154641 RepID=UPI00344AF3DC
MRLPARRLATTTLTAFLLIGVTGPAAMAAGSDSSRGHTAAVAQAPVADAKALLAQAKSLGDLSSTLKPATELLTAVLKADNGRLTPQESAQHAAAVKDAIARIGVAPATTLPAPASAPAPDVRADALVALQASVDTLLKVSATGDAGQVQPAATNLLTGLVNVVAATLLGGGLPAPDLAGLPALPNLPASQRPSASQQSTAQLPASQQLPTQNLQTGGLPTGNLMSGLLSGLLPTA